MAMIRVTVGSTTESKSVIVDDSATVEKIFKDNNIVTANCSVSLNSTPVKDLSKTLASLGATEDSYLFAVFNSKNA